MTRKTATGGQSLLISGALKMARRKRVPSNPNYHHRKLTTLESHTRQLRAAIENHHLLAGGAGHQVGRLEVPRDQQQQVRDGHESDSNSATNSMSGFSSPISPTLQDFTSSPTATGQATPINQVPDGQHEEDQHNKHNSSQATSGKNKKLFPQKLWDLINDERYSFCLRWSDDGQFVYLNRDEFEDSYLKTTENQFHTQKAISFVRQMNMYGFRKVDDCYYENDNFKRGCEHLLKNMTRKHPNRLNTSNTNNSAANTTNALAAANEAETPAELPHFLYHKSMSSQQQDSILGNIISNNNEHHQNQPLNLHRSQFIDQIQHLQNLQQQQRQQQQQHQQQQQLQQQQSQVVDCTIQWLTILAAISYNLNMHVDNP